MLEEVIAVENENAQRLEMPLYVLELPVRPYNVFDVYNLGHVNKIRNLGDLVQLTESDLLSMRGIGRVSLKEIKDKLSQYGLNLKGEPPHNKKGKIVEFAKQGLTREQIAEKVGASYGYVLHVVSSKKLKVPRQTKRGKINPLEINPLIAQGRTLQEIGNKLDVRKQTVAQYINRTGQYNLWRENRKSRIQQQQATEYDD